MYVTHDADGKIKSLIFGNINLLKDSPSFITMPSGYIINSNTEIDPETKEVVACEKTNSYYEITELTKDAPFELEKL